MSHLFESLLKHCIDKTSYYSTTWGRTLSCPLVEPHQQAQNLSLTGLPWPLCSWSLCGSHEGVPVGLDHTLDSRHLFIHHCLSDGPRPVCQCTALHPCAVPDISSFTAEDTAFHIYLNSIVSKGFIQGSTRRMWSVRGLCMKHTQSTLSLTHTHISTFLTHISTYLYTHLYTCTHTFMY